MTEFMPMSFQEGVDTTVTSTSGFVYAATSLELQEAGVMLDYAEANPPFAQKRVLVPWSRVAAVTQNVQE